MVVDLYRDSLKLEQSKVLKSEIKQAVLTGFSQFNTYFVLGGLMFLGGVLVHITSDDGEDAIDTEAVFSAIMPLIYGAF